MVDMVKSNAYAMPIGYGITALFTYALGYCLGTPLQSCPLFALMRLHLLQKIENIILACVCKCDKELIDCFSGKGFTCHQLHMTVMSSRRRQKHPCFKVIPSDSTYAINASGSVS